MAYQCELIKKVSQAIKDKGFRVFVSESGTHGFYSDSEGKRVVSFNWNTGGISFNGNYQSNTCGTSWRLSYDKINITSFLTSDLTNMLYELAPSWAISSTKVSYTSVDQFLTIYNSSKYQEL